MSTKFFTSFLLILIGCGTFFGSINIDVFQDNSYWNLAYAEPLWSDTCYDEVECQKKRDAEKQWTTSNNSSKEIEKLYASVAEGLNMILGIISIVVSPAVMLAGWLMSPDWTSGDLFGLRAVFYKLWITISNITYFIYAIMLIFIALATIFGSDHYGYKALLPKLALGILLVPFTWWAVQFVISTATIVTASVMSIPHETLNKIQAENSQPWWWWNKPSIPTKIEISGDDKIETKGKEATQKCTASTCKSPKDFLASSAGMYGYMMVYAYGVFQINEVKEINTTTDAIKTLGGLVNQWVIAALMFLIFGILTLALIFMLLTRAMMLWVYTIFSPFLTLDIVLGGNLLKDVSKDFSIKEFIGLAFVPAIIGLSLSFWLVIIAAITGGKVVTDGAVKCDTKQLESTEGCKIVGIMGNPDNKIVRKVTRWVYSESQQQSDFLSGPDISGTPEVWSNEIADKTKNWVFETQNIISIGGIDFIFKGNIKASDIGDYAKSTSDTVSVIGAGGGIFGTIIVDIIALLFIWMAFMAAKWVNKVVSAAAAPFEDLGKKVWGMAASAPKYMPLPIPGGSIAGATKWIGQLEGIKDRMADESYKKSKFGQFVQSIDPGSKLTDEQQQRLIKARGSINSQDGINEIIGLTKDLDGQKNMYNQEVKNARMKAISNTEAFKTAVNNNTWIDKPTRDKINELVGDITITPEEKDILITALIKGYAPDRIKSGDFKNAVSGAKAHLSNAGGGWSSSNSSSSSGWSAAIKISPHDNSIAIQIWNGQAFTIGKKDNKIEDSKLDEWSKTALKSMKKMDFISQLVMSGVPELQAKDIAESIDGLFQKTK
jgi:hypothetical protein